MLRVSVLAPAGSKNADTGKEGSCVAAKMGGVASLALDVVAFALLGLALLRVLAGITITDLHNWYIAQVKRAREEAALSVGLISKFLYPLLLCENVQLKSEPYRTERTNTLVRDEYRWLENKGNIARHRWLAEQQKCTQRIMQQTLASGKDSFKTYLKDVKECDNIGNIDMIYERGSSVFFWKRTHASGCSSHLFVADSITADTLGRVAGQTLPTAANNRPQRPSAPRENCRELISVDGLTPLGGSVTMKAGSKQPAILIGTWVCGDGNSAAYAFSSSAKGQATMRVREVSGGTDLPDVISGLHGPSLSVAWLSGKTGFFYTCLIGEDGQRNDDKSIHFNGLACVFYHVLGTSQDKDVMVLSAPSPADEQRREFYTVQMSVDNRFLLISVSEENAVDVIPSIVTETAMCSRPNRFFYMDVTDVHAQRGFQAGTIRKLIDGSFGAFCWDYIGNTKQDFYFRTNYKAARFRVVRLQLPDAATPDTQESCLQAQEWIPENARVLESANIAAKAVLVLKYRRRQYHEVVVYDLDRPQIGDNDNAVELPKDQCDGIEGPWCDYYSSSIFYRTSNYANPGCIWRAKISRADGETGEINMTSFEPLFTPEVPGFDMFDFETVEEMILTKEFSGGSSSKNASPMKRTIKENTIAETWRDSTTGTESGSLRNSSVHVLLFRARNDKNDEARLPKPEGRARRLSGVPGALSSNSALSTLAGNPKPARPCVLCVYGGMDMDCTPTFSAALALYVKHFGATICVLRVDLTANLARAVDCVLESAVYLVDTGVVTSPHSLSLYGGTTGALLCAAALNARPDLFSAAVLQDGIFDLMRVHRLNPPMVWCGDGAHEALPVDVNTEAGIAQAASPAASSWGRALGGGDSETSPEECATVLRTSPFHNIKTYWVGDDELSYPAVLVRASSDSVVNHAHSLKYTAELQRVWGANDRAMHPLLLDFETELSAQHGTRQASQPSDAQAKLRDAEALLFIEHHCRGVPVER